MFIKLYRLIAKSFNYIELRRMHMLSNSNDEFFFINISIPDTPIFVLTFRPYNQS